MNMTAPPLELHALEKLREEELEEARAIQSVMGDSVLFCTDGITDAFDRKEEQFGIERLQAICGAQRLASPTVLLERVFAAVESFSCGQEQQDDMAAAVFHFYS
jgi:sigma-B regulation protein RsbU (phosphoserine phosphatase)